MAPPDVVAVVPTYNEAANLPRLIPTLLSHGYRVLVVDDNSPDGTGRIAQQLAANEPRVTVLHRRRKEGIGPAYAEGFARALTMGAMVVGEMDADFSHDPADLPRLVEALEAGADVALGSRYVPGGATPDWPWPRRLLSQAGNVYARTVLGLPVRDVTGGFRAFRASALRRLDPAGCGASGYAFQVEMVWRAVRQGLEVVEIPIVFRDRELGASKMHGGVVLEAIRLVSKAGLRRWLPWMSEEDRWS
ncbi:MAG: polyprenol monophosphomannose synthase [Acidimicrobiia bacterium]